MSIMWRLLRLYKPYTAWMLLGLGLSLITVLANVSLLAISGWFISSMALAGASAVSINYFTPAALIRGAAITRTAGRYGERLVTHEATFRLLAELRVWFYHQLEPRAAVLLEQYRSGDVLSRIRADIDTLNNVYLRILIPSTVALLASLIVVLVLAYYHPLLALAELSLLLLAAVLIPWLMSRLNQITSLQMIQSSTALRTQLVSDLQGMGELLVYGAADRQAVQLAHSSQLLVKQQQQLNRLNSFAQHALGFAANLAMWLMLVLAIPLVEQNQLAPAELAMLSLLALAGFEAIAAVPLAWQSWGETLAAAQRIFALSDQRPVVTEATQPRRLTVPITIRFEQVGFRYQNNGAWVLQNFNFSLAPRQKVLILGANGSGKSTIVRLLLRFREPNSGHLLLNEQPIQHYASEAVRARFAVAEQHTHVFNSTIMDNLLLANPEADSVQIEQACRAVLLHDFIQQQPDAYHTWVGETGVRLSGGQLQRLSIARALLKPACFLVLDEPTEGLDPETALSMMRNILAWVESKEQGLLVITHQRLGIEKLVEVVVMP
ncbi:thiol reductant ABC exporter subunit CydC [Thiolinea disciformis]|uniref:thiol reductant ABC exporter subunit CydC n=1 Tax=Thiolinea disciformis TaxID=125614 RepID=UPI00037DF071|nr:thiol reductant ABC exporter subunit CydC [Thiolinea disciformis]